MDKVKQVIVIRRDLHCRRGKEIAQGSHASMKWIIDRLYDPIAGPPWKSRNMKANFSQAELDWLDDKWTKVTLQVNSLEELEKIYQNAKATGLEAHIIEDEGLTEFHQNKTKTAVAIGPDLSSLIDPITKHLKLY